MKTEHDQVQRRDDQAVLWATRLDQDELNATQQAELNAWLGSDPVHGQRLEEARRFFKEMYGTVPVVASAGGWSVRAAQRAVRHNRRRTRSWALCGLAAAAALVVMAIWVSQRPRNLATQMAQRTSVTLADGSRVDLNARTALVVDVTKKERRVKLTHGEVFFSVAKETARPFVVETSLGSIRVIGTQFNVRVADPGRLEITVLEGSVSVQSAEAGARPDVPPEEAILTVNERLAFDGDGFERGKLDRKQAEDAVAWQRGKVVFEDTPLDSAVLRFRDYHSMQVTVDKHVAALLLGGRFTLDDFEEFLATVQQALPVQVLRADKTIRIVPR